MDGAGLFLGSRRPRYARRISLAGARCGAAAYNPVRLATISAGEPRCRPSSLLVRAEDTAPNEAIRAGKALRGDPSIVSLAKPREHLGCGCGRVDAPMTDLTNPLDDQKER